jgi:hypothetical protein
MVRSGIRAAFAGRNARRGGYNGRPMLLISRDDQSNVRVWLSPVLPTAFAYDSHARTHASDDLQSTKATANINTLINDNSVLALIGTHTVATLCASFKTQ